MHFIPEPPFNNKWEKAYKTFDPSDGRYKITFHNSDGTMGGISYARYLLSVHLGYEIPWNLVVDHKNDIKTDDRIENLQLLTPEENRLKQEYRYVFYQQAHYYVQCAYCEFCYLISERDLKMKQAKNLEYIFCSRRCAANFHCGKKTTNLMVSYE